MKEIRILGKPNELTYVTQNWKFTKMKPNLRILENGNELINLALSLSNVPVACDNLAEGERLSERMGKPTAKCNRQVDTRLTLRKMIYKVFFLNS